MIKERLLSLKEEAYAAYQRRLIPSLSTEQILGVRTPALRKLARELRGTAEAEAFLNELPHETLEENNLHALLLENETDFASALMKTRAFLPYVNNWATCDQLSPGAFAADPEMLLVDIAQWLSSDHVYTVRFAVGMLMRYFLDERFDMIYPERIAAIVSKEYYVNMAVAWYFATALTKRYDAVLPYFEKQTLDNWTHNKAIQKALESRLVPDESKAHLRTLKV